MNQPVLEVRHLRLSFQTISGRLQAVRDVSFSVAERETLALVGESGCGKSATCRAIMGLIARTAVIEGGEILLNGENLLTKSQKELRAIRGGRIAMIFQDPMTSLDPTMKIGRQITEAIRLHRRVSAAQAKARALELLGLVGIEEPERRFGQYPHEFSGGQRQRIGIARALATEPRFIVCDEPISALDVSIQAQVVNLLRALQRQRGLTYLFIAHDLSMVKYISDRIGVMWRGRIVEMGSAAEVCEHPIHPYTRSLISAIPQPDPRSERTRRRIPYQPDPKPGESLREVAPGHFVLCTEDFRV